MSNCTDCFPQENDPCGGEKVGTNCITNKVGFPYLGIQGNTDLDEILQILFTTIQNLNERIEELE